MPKASLTSYQLESYCEKNNVPPSAVANIPRSRVRSISGAEISRDVTPHHKYFHHGDSLLGFVHMPDPFTACSKEKDTDALPSGGDYHPFLETLIPMSHDAKGTIR